MIQSVGTDDSKLSQESNLTAGSHAGRAISYERRKYDLDFRPKNILWLDSKISVLHQQIAFIVTCKGLSATSYTDLPTCKGLLHVCHVSNRFSLLVRVLKIDNSSVQVCCCHCLKCVLIY